MEKLLSFMKIVDDPRDENKICYPLLNILFMSIVAVLCGAVTWLDVEDFSTCRADWFKRYIDLSAGIPSRYTFRRLFTLINPKSLEKAFQKWSELLAGVLLEGCQVAIDGKQLRGSKRSGKGLKALQCVSAWCHDHELILGQVMAEEKSNEITAIPELLDLLTLKKCVVSIDAAGCQKAIVEKIVDKKADYLLAVKKNQPTLHEKVIASIAPMVESGSANAHDSFDESHGRTVRRRVFVGKADPKIKTLGWLKAATVVAVESISDQSGKIKSEWRYYLSSVKNLEAPFAQYVRNHWGIENKVHWILDVHMKDDQHQAAEKNSVGCLSVLKRVALNMVRKKDKTPKKSVRRKLKLAGWDEQYLESLLF